MGIIDPNGFAGGAMQLDPALSLKAFEHLDTKMSLEQRVSYAWRIALNNVAEGIFNLAVRRGIDPRDFSLMAFGAAGPMMLPSMLDLVPLRRVIVPPHPGLFSALGLLSSDQVFTEERSVSCDLNEAGMAVMEETFAALEATLHKRVADSGAEVRFERSFDGRLQGQGWETPFVPAPSSITAESVDPLVTAFHDVYEMRNGNRFPYLPVEVLTLRVNAVVPATKVDYPPVPVADGSDTVVGKPMPIRYLYGDETQAMEYDRSLLRVGHRVPGPAIVREAMSTTFIPAGHEAVVGTYGELVIE